MDSLTQVALGTAVTVATMGRRTAVWKAALWGAIAGTLPDLDSFVDHGNAILSMVLHRGETHAPFWLTLFSLPFAMAVARLHGEWALWKRWWLALWLALVTHPLLDAMTVYGTQLGLPFTNYPYGVGSVFIIDPLYTVPLLVGGLWALGSGGSMRGLRANTIGLVLSTAYLGWSVVAQQRVEQIAQDSLRTQGITAERLLVTPTAFNTLLWRVVAVSGSQYLEGFYSVLDAERRITTFERVDRGDALMPALQGIDGVQRIAAFTKGLYKLHEVDGKARITDLRMGQEPTYSFSFVVADARDGRWEPVAAPTNAGGRPPDVRRSLQWVWQRMQGELLPPPQ